MEKLTNAVETSTVLDSEDFFSEEWQLLMKKRRRNNARKIYDSASSDESEETTLYHHTVSQDDHHNTKRKKGNQSNNILQLPTLPKALSILSQPHVSNVTTEASRTDEVQHNVPISKFLLLL